MKKDVNFKIKAEQRWIELFDILQKSDIKFENFSILIEYAFTIPGMHMLRKY